VKYNYGTCENNRDVVFRNLIKKKIHYTFSGHSHRSGLYHIVKDRTFTDRAEITGQMAKITGKTGKFDTSKLNGASRILVSACGGPIAVQNKNKELANWGLDYPSGSYVKFSGTNESGIGLKIPKIETAKPRLAVAFDFADTVGGKVDGKLVKGIFDSIKSDSNSSPLLAKLNSSLKLPDVNWIANFEIYLFKNNKAVGSPITFQSKLDKNQIVLTPADNVSDILLDIMLYKEHYILFNKIKFDANILDGPFSNYDIKDGWTYQIEIKRPTTRKCNQHGQACRTVTLPEGYVIQRHSRWGEVPNHLWYSRCYAEEYNFPWKKYTDNNREQQYPE
jgi:hypothetical protein